MSMTYGVLGSGSWGTAIAKLLGEREEVYLWGRDESLIKQIQVNRENQKYLPGVDLPYEVRATYELDHVLADTDVIVIAVPSHAFVSLLDRIRHALEDKYATVNLSKGFDPDSGRRLSQEFLQVRETLDDFYFLTGPSHAEEVAEQRPTSVVIGGGHEAGRIRLQEVFHRDYFRVYRNDDLVGLEMGAALKNIIAIAAGISDGLQFGVNARAGLITRGLQEIRRISSYEGGDPETLFGLGGLGDLIVTSTSDLSRNYRLGLLLAEGFSIGEAREQIGQIIEGINATRIAHDRVMKGEIRAPIVNEMFGILFKDIDPVTAVENLLNRDVRPEFPDGGPIDD
jgi:glycerol-3-phosphate dehydrogenase (NAD(P)+)